MIAAVRSRAGWLTIVTGAVLALTPAGCSMLPALPGLPGMGPPGLEPGLVEAADPANSERPPFFVQWKATGLPGLTKRPAIDKSTPPPEYPPSAVRNEESGTTSIESCLTVEGKLVDIHLFKSSGSKILDETTLAWAKTAKYTPAEFNGEPFAICGYRFDYEWRVVVERDRDR
jgi:TonB family protein